jgi:transcriptional regulator with GAF, ATPase, and Fis domain
MKRIVDELVALTGAERGFLVLRTAEKAYEMVAARTLDREDVQKPGLKISRAVAEEVARTGTPLLTTNAQADARLAESESVEAMRLRSVLCVPLSGRSGFLGFLYLDHRFAEGAFDGADLNLLTAFADGAAIALENLRLVTELRERTEELARSKARVEELNRLLEERVARQRQELDEVRSLLRDRGDTPLKYDYPAIVGSSPALREALRLVDHGVETSVPVLILGESGTGKELVARAIHALGPRKDRPFVSENCAAIPETLLESALFGHVRGAFTGADRDRAGLFEQAHGGTLFLDEIGDLPLATQVKLLRVLETGELRRVGGKDVTKVDVRIVCATHRDVPRMVEEGAFREDLYYRIHVLTIRLPALRERREDIPVLVEHFLDEAAAGGPRKRISDEALGILEAYPWPGNVRQLRNEIQRAVALSDQVILPEVLGEDVRRRSVPSARLLSGGGVRPLREIVQEAADVIERRAVLEALLRHGWKKGQAAEALQVSRPTLDAKIRRHGIRRAGGEIEE